MSGVTGSPSSFLKSSHPMHPAHPVPFMSTPCDKKIINGNKWKTFSIGKNIDFLWKQLILMNEEYCKGIYQWEASFGWLVTCWLWAMDFTKLIALGLCTESHNWFSLNTRMLGLVIFLKLRRFFFFFFFCSVNFRDGQWAVLAPKQAPCVFVQCLLCVSCHTVSCLNVFLLRRGPACAGPFVSCPHMPCCAWEKKSNKLFSFFFFFFNFFRVHTKLLAYFFQIYIFFLGLFSNLYIFLRSMPLFKFNRIENLKLKSISTNNKLVIVRKYNINYYVWPYSIRIFLILNNNNNNKFSYRLS